MGIFKNRLVNRPFSNISNVLSPEGSLRKLIIMGLISTFFCIVVWGTLVGVLEILRPEKMSFGYFQIFSNEFAKADPNGVHLTVVPFYFFRSP